MRRSTSVSEKLGELFGIDLRAMAVFRISFAGIILFDLFSRLENFAVFYTDAGLLPRRILMSNPNATSLYFIGDGIWLQGALIAIQILCAAALLVGWRTQLAAFLSWFFMLSLHTRFRSILGGGDEYLRYLLMWSIFLPLGARCSVDALHSIRRDEPKVLLSWGTAAIVTQNLLVYLMAAGYKLLDTDWYSGRAMHYVLQIFNYAREDTAVFLLQFPALLYWVSVMTIWLEFLAPVLMLWPRATVLCRTLGVTIIVALHAGFISCLFLKNFPWVSISAMSLMLPSPVWDFLSKHVYKGPLLWFERCFGRLSRILPPGAEPVVRPRRWQQWTAAYLLACLVTWNMVHYYKARMPEFMRETCEILTLRQRWSLFTPPSKRSGWLIVAGVLPDGREVDLYQNGRPISWEKPTQREANKNARWQRLVMVDFVFQRNKRNWDAYADYFKRQWERSHGPEEKIQSVVFYMMQRDAKPGIVAPFKKKEVHRRDYSSLSAKGPTRSSAHDKTALRPVVGTYIPADYRELQKQVADLLRSAPDAGVPPESIRILIVPHAAYRFAGPIQAAGYHAVEKKAFDVAVLLAPTHRDALKGAAVPDRRPFRTPLGPVPLDTQIMTDLSAAGKDIRVDGSLNWDEHSLLTQLPYLQARYPLPRIVPVFIGEADLRTHQRIGETLARVIRGKRALIIISTDLSHYPSAANARAQDERAIEAIRSLDPEKVLRTAVEEPKAGIPGLKTAFCGRGALLAGLYAARDLGVDGSTLAAYSNSGELPHGDPKRAVGYASILLTASGALDKT